VKAACGLSDLARVFAALGSKRDAAVADWLEFQAKPVTEPVERVQVEPQTAHIAKRGQRGTQLMPTPFWHVVRVEQRAPVVGQPRPHALSLADLEGLSNSSAPPPSAPLATDRHLTTACRRLLAQLQPTRSADLRKLVSRLARADVVTVFPRRTRTRMPERVVVVADRSRRLIPLWDDQFDVVRVLRSSLRRGAVETLVVRDRPTHGREVRELERLVRRGGGPVAPVLVLSDLGALADEATRTAWREFGRSARRVGSLTSALTPCLAPTRASVDPRLWRTASWEGGSIASSAGRADGVERLLRLTSIALRVEPALLRAVRMLLPRSDADAQSELDVWSHEAARGEQYQGFELRDQTLRARLRRELAREAPELQRRLVEILEVRHAKALRDLWFEELVTLEPFVAHGVLPRGELEEARKYFSRFASSLAAANPDEDARMALRSYFCRFELRAPEELWTDPQLGQPLLDAWQLAHLDDRSAIPPQSVDSARIADLVGSDSSTYWSLHQLGQRLVLAPHEPGAAPPQRASPLHATVSVGRAGVSVAGPALRGKFAGGDTPSIVVAPSGSVTLSSESSVIELAPCRRPPWASAMGRDKFGLWVEFEVKGVTARMRWIPPGTFLMGASAAEKNWAVHDETAHPVTLTSGFWLAETPVTQALWTAVMRKNPSRFRTPDRPVERASWDDCRMFHHKLNKLVPWLEARFPTEAEWEYACRAGTTTSTYVGDLDIVGVHNAPILDDIAWYGGNSGVDEAFPNASDSSDWSEKHHAHNRAATHPVGSKPPNPYGLRDMLGNVYEWCSDWLDDYPMKLVDDPKGPSSRGYGYQHVLRGGSWASRARDVRAAARFAFHAWYSNGSCGVRLARGPIELPDAKCGGAEAEPRPDASEQAARVSHIRRTSAAHPRRYKLLVSKSEDLDGEPFSSVILAAAFSAGFDVNTVYPSHEPSTEELLAHIAGVDAVLQVVGRGAREPSERTWLQLHDHAYLLALGAGKVCLRVMDVAEPTDPATLNRLGVQPGFHVIALDMSKSSRVIRLRLEAELRGLAAKLRRDV
jgi:formylglycine-generating enzyme required for sulfatase activity